jgi:hypothetical protein
MIMFTTIFRTMKQFLMYSALVLCIGLSACHDDSAPENPAQIQDMKPQVLEQGMLLRFSAGAPGLSALGSTKAIQGSSSIMLTAPARVVASISPGISTSDKVVIFDNPQATSLYSQYRQSRANLQLMQKSAERAKDMLEHNAATIQDVNQAETALMNARTQLAENEGQLRTLGFDPWQVEKAENGSVWMMCDVPEAQLREVQQGEDVEIQLSSFPGIIFNGKAEKTGDVVDPITRTVKVRISLKNKSNKILPGMFGSVNFAEPQNGITILPIEALITVEGKHYVFVARDSLTFERRQVTVAANTSTQTFLAGGIKSGETVITRGAMLLKGLSFGY